MAAVRIADCACDWTTEIDLFTPHVNFRISHDVSPARGGGTPASVVIHTNRRETRGWSLLLCISG